MNTIGIFAGRGDVLVAMALAFILGFILAWKVRGWWANIVFRRSLRKHSETGGGSYWDPDIELRYDYEMLPVGETPLAKAQKRLQWALAHKAKVLENILWFDGNDDNRLWTEFTNLDTTIDRLIAEGK